MKSVRTAPVTMAASASGPTIATGVMVMIVAGESVEDLVGTLVGEERTAADQDDLNQGRGDFASRIAAGRMNASLLNGEPRAIFLMIRSSRSAARPWTYCGVTAASSTTTPATFIEEATRRRADIVDRRRCEFRQRSDIVEQTETTSHRNENGPVGWSTTVRC